MPPEPPTPDPELLTTMEAAKFLNVDGKTLQNWRYIEGHGPSYCYVGSYVRYRKSALIAFVREMKR